MLARHGADVVRAPALRETSLPPGSEVVELAHHPERGDAALVVLLTGVGARARASALAGLCPRFAEHLAKTRIVARGPKPVAALRELKIVGGLPVPTPFTWRQ